MEHPPLPEWHPPMKCEIRGYSTWISKFTRKWPLEPQISPNASLNITENIHSPLLTVLSQTLWSARDHSVSGWQWFHRVRLCAAIVRQSQIAHGFRLRSGEFLMHHSVTAFSTSSPLLDEPDQSVYLAKASSKYRCNPCNRNFRFSSGFPLFADGRPLESTSTASPGFHDVPNGSCCSDREFE